MIDFIVKLLGLAAELEPIFAEWLRGAVDANPEHPISRRVKDIMPERAEIHDVVDELKRKKGQ